MRTVLSFLTRTRGSKRLHITDMLTYAYLLLGTVIMFGPVIWLVMSSSSNRAQPSPWCAPMTTRS